MADAPRDDNNIPVLLAVSNVDGVTPVTLWADPTTHRLLVSMSSDPGGADTQVQFNDGGSLSGEAGMTYAKASDILTLVGGLAVGAVNVITDSGGTATLSNIDALDATTEVTIESAIDTLANLTSIQGNTVTLTGALIRSGNHSLTLTTTDTTDVTLPTTGTLATVAGSETLTNKTLTSANVGTDIAPTADDGASLGTSSEGFSDLFLASGAKIQVNNTNPKRTIVLSAAGGAPLTTAGCSASTKVEAATNDINYYVLDFDASTEEHAFWNLVMPDNYDGSTLTARFHWTNAGGGAAETVDWGIAMLGLADNDPIDSALGSEVTTTDTWIAQGDLHISPESTAITPAGTPTGGEMMNIVVARKVASDDLTGDARLIAVHLEYGISSYSD